MNILNGHLDEIFFSIQGEGGELGRPHVFCRLGGCPLRCVYCDTPRSWKQRKQFEIHTASGTELKPNPIAADAVVTHLTELLAECELNADQVCLSLTGGEVLEQADFAAQIAELWPAKVLLETSGNDAEAFARVADKFDIVSLDWKTPSLMAQELYSEHKQCLSYIAEKKLNAQLKMVLSVETTAEEVDDMYRFVSEHCPSVPIFLQPLTPMPKSPLPPTSAQMLKWLTAGVSRQLDVRVVPQVHPLLQLR